MDSKNKDFIRSISQLELGLDKAVYNFDIDCKDFVWIGIIKNPTATKSKYELYWFLSDEDYDGSESSRERILECESLMCESLQDVYTRTVLKIEEVLVRYEDIKVVITDLVKGK